MFTPDSLLEIAAAAEADYKSLRVLHPPGTIHAGRNDALDRMDKALACAEWMTANGHAQLSHVGSFGVVDFKKKERVRIKKGARTFTTKPASDPAGLVSKRDQIVTLHFVDGGYVDPHNLSMPRGVTQRSPLVRQPRVTWAGAGGYWRWTDITNVEQLTEVIAA